jgi:sugar lactone lactonase YvrE
MPHKNMPNQNNPNLAVITGPVTPVNAPLATLGECPRWDERTNSLFWIDIDGQKLWCLDTITGESKHRDIGQSIGCFALREQGGFILGLRSGYGRMNHWDAPIELLQSPSWDTAQVRFNDGRCDRQGRFWAGTMFEPRTHKGATLFRLDPDYTFSAHANPVTVSNGFAQSYDGTQSSDNQFIYWADTPEHVVYRYPFNPLLGTLGEPTEFVRYPHGGGRPDGASVDSAGNYWIALFNGSAVQCFSPSGELLAEVVMPTKNITCITFAGPDLCTAYVTTARIRLTEEELKAQPHAGGLFSFRTSIPGLKEPRFLG